MSDDGIDFQPVAQTSDGIDFQPSEPSYLEKTASNVLPDLEAFFPEGLILHDACLQAQNPVHATLHDLIAGYTPALRRRMLLIHQGDEVDFYRALIEREFRGAAIQGQVISL